MPCHFNHFLYEIWNNKICKDLIVFAINFERNSCSLVLWNCDWYECTFGDPLTQERTKYYCFPSFLSLWPRFIQKVKKEKKKERRNPKLPRKLFTPIWSCCWLSSGPVQVFSVQFTSGNSLFSTSLGWRVFYQHNSFYCVLIINQLFPPPEHNLFDRKDLVCPRKRKVNLLTPTCQFFG